MLQCTIYGDSIEYFYQKHVCSSGIMMSTVGCMHTVIMSSKLKDQHGARKKMRHQMARARRVVAARQSYAAKTREAWLEGKEAEDNKENVSFPSFLLYLCIYRDFRQ